MLEDEAKVLEYFRHKYLRQAFVVFFICGAVIFLGYWFFDDFWLKLLFLVLSLIVFYLMVKALSEELQTKGESLILKKKNEIFKGLDFDFGYGLDEKNFEEQSVVSGYRVRECKNVMKGEKFVFEEDWFYSQLSSKALKVTSTYFEGVVLAISVPVDANFEAEVLLKSEKVIFFGQTDFLEKKNIDKGIMELFKFFKASKVYIFGKDRKIYFLIKTKMGIFYRFSLIRTNFLSMFVKRVYRLTEIAENIYQLFSNCN